MRTISTGAARRDCKTLYYRLNPARPSYTCKFLREPAGFSPFNHIARPLLPCPHEFICRENPHLRLRGEECGLRQRRSFLIYELFQQLGFKLHEKLIGDGKVERLHTQEQVISE